jgi:hypothetical protein
LSDLAKACKIVAFVSHGTKLIRPFLTRKVEVLYHELLWSMTRNIDKYTLSVEKPDLFATVKLLVLYDICSAFCKLSWLPSLTSSDQDGYHW